MESFEPFLKAGIEQSIPSRFEEQVVKHGDRLAVKSADDQLTYESLNQYANRIASALLKEKDPTTNSPVAIISDQGAPFIAATLGVLKAGMAYAALDSDNSKAELGQLVKQLDSGIILTDNQNENLGKKLIQPGQRRISIEKLDEGLSSKNPEFFITPDSLAYVYFTTGSTGQTKGVMDTHRNVLHNIMRYTNSLEISPEDRLTLLHSPCLSACVSSQFGALLNGASVFPNRIRPETLENLPNWLVSEGITKYHSVPLAFRHAVNESTKNSSLRLIRLEGDEASIEDLKLFNAYCPPGSTLVNGLGTTETGICRQFFYEKDSDLPQDRVPIGYSVEDMNVFVIDDQGNEAAFPNKGEICVRSKYLSPGYWKDLEKTEEAFSQEAGNSRVWKTGDLGAMREEGCLDYLGRKIAGSKNKVQSPDEGRSSSTENEPFIKPKTRTEKILASFWSDIFNHERIGLSDDFFRLDGDSVKAMQLVNRINLEFQIRVSVREIFNNPRLKDLAQLLEYQLSLQ